jgi:hypothetical protein
LLCVIAGLVPAIHEHVVAWCLWMAATRAAMTGRYVVSAGALLFVYENRNGAGISPRAASAISKLKYA